MRISRNDASARGGFTLVEMLVAVTLVVMMMLMFANVFGVAVGTMRNQRSLANNDQKARALTALLRSDLNAATYKSQLYSDSAGLVALFAGDVVDPNQKGYFYIAENDPGSETDDILQFTIWVQDPISGRAQLIGRPDGNGAFDPNPADLNQPDGDDGILNNGVTWSRAAEVSYFLRNGTLYRRVLLLRDPLPHNPKYPMQPTMGLAGEGTDAFSTYSDRLIPDIYNADADQDQVSGGTIGDFWNDFDSSACWVYNNDVGAWQLYFNSIDSLDNNRGHENHPLGMPEHRFGHDPGVVAVGQPLEFLTNLPPTPQYIGRFTHEETSSPAFGFPGPASNPFSYENGSGHSLLDGRVEQYADGPGPAPDGPRGGEDLVMSGVEAFNIEVLDEGWTLEATDRVLGGFPKFVNLGQDLYPTGFGIDPVNQFAGDFAIDRNLNRLDSMTTTGYGLHTPFHSNTLYSTGDDVLAGNRFDTWHPAATAVGSGLPPYRSLSTFNTSEYDDIFTGWINGVGVDDTTTSVSGYPDVITLNNQSIAFVCVQAGTTGPIEPEWPLVPGSEVSDGSAIWRAIDNRIGLKMMRITIRYVDTQTGGLKQLSLYHSFVESR